MKNSLILSGKVVTVPENLMSGVVCASGSSPAYVYMFIEALADGADKIWNTEKRCLQACCTDCTWLGKNGS